MKRTRNQRRQRRRELRTLAGVLAVVLLSCVNYFALLRALEAAAW